MLKIRLTRMGAKKNPFYRIIVIDSKEAGTIRLNSTLR